MDSPMIIVLRTALIFAAIGFLWHLARKEKPPDNQCHIKFPRTFLVVGIVVTIFFLGIIIAAIFFAESKYLPLAFIPFLSLGLIIILNCCNWEIRINENEATYRNMFRRHFVFKAEEVESLRITTNVIRIKVRGRTLWVDPYAMNLHSLAAFLRKNPNLRKAVHQGRHILR